MEAEVLIEVLAAILGLIFGSFANVCITRIAADESVVRPRSHCRGCGHMIAWYDNIPVLSFMLLGGRCRHCHAPIGWRYPIVEALTGVWFWAALHWAGADWPGVKWCVFGFLLITLSVLDLEERILPDELTLGGWLAGLALAVVAPPPPGIITLALNVPSQLLSGLAEAGIASLTAALLLWFLGWFYKWLNRIWKRDIDPLGEGDPRMIGMVAAFLGLEGTVLAMIIAGVAGTVLGVVWILWNRKKVLAYELPFGTFLGAGALAIAVLGWFGKLQR